MSEFIAQHVPDDVDAFTGGYLEAAEFTDCNSDNDDTLEGAASFDDALGWSPAAIETAKTDCADFQKANRADLDEMKRTLESSGYDDASAGRDFWFTRNGHGVGFWDRGAGAIGDKLSEATRPYGSAYPYANRIDNGEGVEVWLEL